MRLLTLNLWQCRLGKLMIKHLQTVSVDFACLQEAVVFEGLSGGLLTTYQKIGDSLRLSEQYFSPLMSSTLDDRPLQWGNAICAAQRPIDLNTVFTRGAYKPDFTFGTDDYNIRAFQHASYEVAGKRLHIINHHGHHIDAHKLGDDETMRQSRQILEYISRLEGAVIFAGDLNLAPESESVALLSSKLRNLSVEYGLTTTRSSLTTKREVCDYIFVNDAVRVNEFLMDTTIVSDHNALIVDFDLI